MKNKVLNSIAIGSLLSVSMLASVTANAGNLPPQDSMVSTIFDKSVIHGSLAHDADGSLIYDKNGNARFQYSGTIYSFSTNALTGELMTLTNTIGSITGEAAFPKQFVALSAGVNSIMDQMIKGTFDGNMPPMPAVVPWTCNHCVMTAGGTTYISIVDALDPYKPDGVTLNPYYSQAMADKLNAGLMGGADGSSGAEVALATMRMDGRAFTGLTPASFDPATRTMSVRMAGCSALVAVDGPLAGKVGTLCMNATATFDVSKAIATGTDPNTGMPTYDETSAISADGSSNCVTVMHTPTM